MAALQQMCIHLLLVVKSPTDALYSLCDWPLLKTTVPSFFRKSFGIYYRLKFMSVTCFEGIPVGTNRPEKSESTETRVFSWDAYSSFTFDKCQASLIRYNGNNNFINIAPFKYLQLSIKKHIVKANKTKLHAHVVRYRRGWELLIVKWLAKTTTNKYHQRRKKKWYDIGEVKEELK